MSSEDIVGGGVADARTFGSRSFLDCWSICLAVVVCGWEFCCGGAGEEECGEQGEGCGGSGELNHCEVLCVGIFYEKTV